MTARSGPFLSEVRTVWNWKMRQTYSLTGEVYCFNPVLLLKAQLSCLGVLNNYKWPEIKGLSDFKGTLCHTARWPADLDLKGKRVAIIGSGSSGIQLLATVQPEAGRIFHWIRSPTWITTAFAQQFAGPDGKNFSCELYAFFILS